MPALRTVVTARRSAAATHAVFSLPRFFPPFTLIIHGVEIHKDATH